jgi:hypothetical protein
MSQADSGGRNGESFFHNRWHGEYFPYNSVMTLKTILSGAPVLLLQQNDGVQLNSTFFLRAELPEFDLFGKHSVERSSKTRSRAVPNTPKSPRYHALISNIN